MRMEQFLFYEYKKTQNTVRKGLNLIWNEMENETYKSYLKV